MSDAVRSYTSSGGLGYAGRTSRGKTFRRLLYLLIGAALVWIYWTTRDTHPVEGLVPRDQVYHLRAGNLLESREKAARSLFWQLDILPDEYQAIPEWLGNNFGLPDWVLNNLVSDDCYVSGKDFHDFTDMLVVTRMSRIGCLLERYHRFVDAIEDEYAGGLQLRRMADAEAYYAVRGRTLVFSPSRDALIAALTLREGDTATQLEETISASGGDVQGQIVLPQDDPVGKFIERADFVLSFRPDSIQLSCQNLVRKDWRTAMDDLAAGGPPPQLHIPEAGSVVLAGDFNASLPLVWNTADTLSGGALTQFSASLPLIRGEASAEEAPWRALASGARDGLGSAFAVRWTGFDRHGIVPLPEVELYLETRGGDVAPMLEAIPALEPGQSPVDGTPYRNPDAGSAHFPLGWGGVLEPAVEPVSGGIRLALHPAHLENLPSRNPGTNGGDVRANLYVRIRPVEALELIRTGGVPIAGAGLLGDHTPESFDTRMSELVQGSREVNEVRVESTYDSGALSLDITIDLNTGR